MARGLWRRLHEKVKGGTIELTGGKFPRSALALFRECGVAQPHEIDPTAPQFETQRRYRSNDKRNVAMYADGGGFELPKLEMPKLELPKLELPKFD